jgi:hypothetical protein
MADMWLLLPCFLAEYWLKPLIGPSNPEKPCSACVRRRLFPCRKRYFLRPIVSIVFLPYISYRMELFTKKAWIIPLKSFFLSIFYAIDFDAENMHFIHSIQHQKKWIDFQHQEEQPIVSV